VAIALAGTSEVAAPAPSCYAAVADSAGWREWARDLERVEVLERDSGGRARAVEVELEVFGQVYTARVAVSYDDPALAVRFGLIEAASLTELTGEIGFSPSGSEATMAYRISMTLVRTKAPRIERMVSRKIETALVRDLARHIERGHRRR